MIFDLFIKYRLLLTLFLLPIICSIIRIISPSIKSNYFKGFNKKSYFSSTKNFIPKNDSQSIENLKINNYNNTRIFFETKYNKIKLYLTFSTENYYDDNSIKFSIYLNSNDSTNISLNNNFLNYSQNFKNNLMNVKFIETNDNIFKTQKKYIIKFISINFESNYSNLYCNISFDDFDLILYLQEEKYTFRFFYLLESIINQIVIFTIICLNIENTDHNMQNISLIFWLIIRAKIIISIIYRLIDIFEVGLPIFKLLNSYFHLLIYGEFILSLTDFVSISLFILFLINIGNFLQYYNDNQGNYFYSFNNIIENNTIMRSNKSIETKNLYFVFSIIILIVLIFEYSKNIYLKFIPLYIGIISAIVKYLLQREAMYLKDKQYCISFYFYGVIIYSYYLLIYSIGKFYRIKNSFSIFPFIFAILLYFLLEYILNNEYKLTYIMKEDFKKLKEKNHESCCICLKDFEYNENNYNQLFCKISQYDNINKTNCNHYYHEKCLFLWRKHQNVCPICKKQLGLQKYYYFYEYITCIYRWE